MSNKAHHAACSPTYFCLLDHKFLPNECGARVRARQVAIVAQYVKDVARPDVM